MATTGYAAAIDSNDLVMGYVPEAIWGTTPTAPAFQLIRLDSEGFSGSKSRTRPNEIDPSGQSSAAITTKQEAQGSLNWSVSPSLGQNELLAASLGGVFTGASLFSSTAAGIFTSSAYDGTARTCTITVTGATFTAPATAVGQYVKVSIYVSASVTRVFTGKIKTITSATALALEDCTGFYTDGASVVTGTSSIVSVGANFTTAGTAFSVAITDATNRIVTLTCTGATFTTATSSHFLVTGQFVKLEAAGSPTFNLVGRVKTVSGATIVVLDCVSLTSTELAALTPGALAAGVTTLKGACLRNGTTFNSYTVEKRLKPVVSGNDGLYLRYPGAFPTGGSLDVGVGDYLKGTMSFLVKSETSATAAIGSATYSNPHSYVVIDSVKGIGTVWRNSDASANGSATTTAPVAGTVQKLGIKWNKEGAAAQYGIGSSAALGVSKGKMLVTGSMSTYFANFTLYQEYIAETTGAISFFALDNPASTNGSKGYVITICNATIMNPKVVAGGPGQDIMAEFEVEGNPDNSTAQFFGGKTIQIDSFL